MGLEEALARCAGLVVVDADEPCYRRVFGEVVAGLGRVSGLVEEAGLGVAYVGLDGLEGLYGGEEGVVSALSGAIPAGLGARVGVADAKFPAYVAARVCGSSGVGRVGDDVAGFLASHSVDLLPVSAGLRGELRRFGLHTMGAVASLNGHQLSDQFGVEGLRTWSLCNGVDDSCVVPGAVEEPVVEHLGLPFQAGLVETLVAAVGVVSRRAFARGEVGGRRVGVVSRRAFARVR